LPLAVVYLERSSFFHVMSDRISLRADLDALGIPGRLYSLDGWKDERLCLEQRNGQWMVYFVERGVERPLASFDDESGACDFMLAEMKREL
jgi:hypothetical protein